MCIFYLQDNFGRRGILIFLCAILTIPVYGFLAFAPSVHPLVPTIWLGFTYSIAAVSWRAHKSWHIFFIILLIQNKPTQQFSSGRVFHKPWWLVMITRYSVVGVNMVTTLGIRYDLSRYTMFPLALYNFILGILLGRSFFSFLWLELNEM